MKNNTLLNIGLAGTSITVLCCVTPVLVILVSAVGLSAIVGMLDYVLFPALAVFLIMTGYALWKHRRPSTD